MSKRQIGALLFLTLIGATFAAAFSPLGAWLSVEGIRTVAGDVGAVVQANPLPWVAGFAALCVLGTAVCFPVGPVIGVTAGALFGFWPGTAIVVLAGTVGSTLAFLAARFLFRDWVTRKLGDRTLKLESGSRHKGAIYLLSLRLNPFIPYWLVNLGMGLTDIRTRTFVPLTLIGLIPANLMYAYAGTRLATLSSIADILTPGIILAFLVLSVVPLLVRQVEIWLDRPAAG